MSFLMSRVLYSPFGVIIVNGSVSLIGIVIYWSLIPPFWGGSDEVGLGMLLSGTGAFSEPSNQLLFSNIFLALFARLIPEINGTGSYSLVITGSLLVSSFVFFTLLRKKIRFFSALFLWVVLFLWPVSIISFSVVAGLTTLVGILAFLEFLENRNIGWGLTSALLILMGFLIRDMQALAVIFVASPFVFTKVKKKREGLLLLLAIAVTGATAKLIDYFSYQSPAWSDFNSFNSVRVALTDYGAAGLLLAKPDLLAKHNLSQNDALLLGGWFPVFPESVSKAQVTGAVTDLGPISQSVGKRELLGLGLSGLIQPLLLALTIFGIATLILFFCRRIMVSFIFLGTFIAVISLMGRPSVASFIYAPLATLSILAIYSFGKTIIYSKSILVVAVMSCVVTMTSIFPIIAEKNMLKQEFIESHSSLNINGIIVWGNSIPFELIFPVFGQPSEQYLGRYIGFGWSNLVPTGNLEHLYKSGSSINRKLLSSDGVDMITTVEALNALDIYCQEKFQKNIAIRELKVFPDFKLRNVKCE